MKVMRLSDEYLCQRILDLLPIMQPYQMIKILHFSQKRYGVLRYKYPEFRKQVDIIQNSKKKQPVVEPFTCPICGDVMTHDEFRDYCIEHKKSRTSMNVYAFKSRKTCMKKECRVIHRQNNAAMKRDCKHDWTIRTFGEPFTWKDYFLGELRHKYEDDNDGITDERMVELFSQDTEIPLENLLQWMNGCVKITAEQASILRKNDICYTVETIIALQHKLCESKQEVVK